MSSINRSSLKDRVVFGFWGYQSIIYVIAFFLIVFLFSFFLLGYSPVKQFLPQNIFQKKSEVINLILKIDSLEKDLLIKSLYIESLGAVLAGKESVDVLNNDSIVIASFETLSLVPSKEDSILRSWVQNEDLYNIPEVVALPSSSLEDFVFFKPIDGFIVDSFSVKKKHFGVDIAANTNSLVKSTLDGVVILAEWTYESGHILIIQHTENILSVYMHNSSISKGRNDLVRSGEVVGVVGNSGESSSGPHLHFELWQNGAPINPLDYIDF